MTELLFQCAVCTLSTILLTSSVLAWFAATKVSCIRKRRACGAMHAVALAATAGLAALYAALGGV